MRERTHARTSATSKPRPGTCFANARRASTGCLRARGGDAIRARRARCKIAGARSQCRTSRKRTAMTAERTKDHAVLEKGRPQRFNAYNAPHEDLREFIKRAEEAGEILRIKGADWKLEMGTLGEIVNHARPEPPALLFEGPKGAISGA